MSVDHRTPDPIQFRGMDCNLLADQYRRYLEQGGPLPTPQKAATIDDDIFERDEAEPDAGGKLVRWVYDKLFADRRVAADPES